jgi:subtilisin family serine protease
VIFRTFLLALGLVLGGPSFADTPAAQATQAGQQKEPPQIMVMLRLGAEHFRSGSSYGGDYGDAMGQEARLRYARKLAHEHGLTLVDNWPMQIVGVDCLIMSVNDGRTAEAAAEELSKVGGVQWSQPIYEFEMQGAGPDAYNDRLSAAQPATSRWHLTSLHRFATGRGQTIAIIDSRIDTAQPDFIGQNIQVEDFVPGSLHRAERHGTGVAGIIAARANNLIGIAGVAPGAHILGLHACWERGSSGATVCDSLSLAKAMTYALEHHVDIINLSLSGPRDRLLSTLINTALARGTTVVAAVNQAHPDQSFPSSIAGVLAVADESLSDRHGSVYVAPGRDVPTTEPEGTWSLVNGSSYAAAHVSGLAALLRQLSAHRGAGRSAMLAMGPRGTIDACAAVARVSALDAGVCRSRD